MSRGASRPTPGWPTARPGPRPEALRASGRVWAKVICPKAVSTDNGEKKCETEAQFRFENCEQAITAK